MLTSSGVVMLLAVVVVIGLLGQAATADSWLEDREPAAHPRLILTDARLAEVRRRAKGSPVIRELVDRQLAQARAVLNQPPVERVLEGRRLLRTSRTALGRIQTLAFAYRWTGDRRFADRAIAEMLAVSAFADWNPSHFLDVGEMTAGLAIGYDWLHDILPADAERQIREAIIAKGLQAGREGIAADAWWTNKDTNWAQVCHGGLALGALAVWEHEPALAAVTVEDAVKAVRAPMAGYGPDGAYPEGVGYWTYGTAFNVLLIESLRTALGEDNGLGDDEAFLASAGFIDQMTGPSMRAFRYLDSGGRADPFVLAWFNAAGRPLSDVAVRRHLEAFVARDNSGPRWAAAALAWIEPPDDDDTGHPPRDALFAGKTPVAAFRSAWDDPQATWIAVKGGRANVAHGHMDAGEFVFEAAGVRWATSLGSEDYNRIESSGLNLWDFTPDGDRWTLLRLNHLGHSIPVINGRPPRVDRRSPLRDFQTGDRPGVTVDLSDTYVARTLTRRVGLLDDRRTGFIQDVYQGLEQPGHVRWQMITRADVELHNDGTATLRQDGRSLRLEVDAPDGATMRVVDLSRPAQNFESENPGRRRIDVAVPVDAGDDVTIMARLIPQ
jgi:hypothetical protein